MAEMLGSFAEALILAGRGDEAKSSLDEAISLSRELKSDGLMAETLGFQGDMFFYAEISSLRIPLYEQALQAATRSKEPATDSARRKPAWPSCRCRKNMRGKPFPSLRPLIQQADDSGLKYTSVECSIFMAEAMMQSHDYPMPGRNWSAPCCFPTSSESSR